MCTIMKRQGPSLKYLEEVRLLLEFEGLGSRNLMGISLPAHLKRLFHDRQGLGNKQLCRK